MITEFQKYSLIANLNRLKGHGVLSVTMTRLPSCPHIERVYFWHPAVFDFADYLKTQGVDFCLCHGRLSGAVGWPDCFANRRNSAISLQAARCNHFGNGFILQEDRFSACSRADYRKNREVLERNASMIEAAKTLSFCS